MIKRGYVTEGRRNSRDLNYPIALFTKGRETGDIAINSKNLIKRCKRLLPLKCKDYARNPLHKSLYAVSYTHLTLPTNREV